MVHKKPRPNLSLDSLLPQDLQALQRAADLLDTTIPALLGRDSTRSQSFIPNQLSGILCPPTSSGTSSQGWSNDVDIRSPQSWRSGAQQSHPVGSYLGSMPAGAVTSSEPRRSMSAQINGLEIFDQEGDENSMRKMHYDSIASEPIQNLWDNETSALRGLTTGNAQITQKYHNGTMTHSKLSSNIGQRIDKYRELADNSDESSHESETEVSRLDSQPWENVSLIDPFATSTGSNNSDFLWIEEHENGEPNQWTSLIESHQKTGAQSVQDMSYLAVEANRQNIRRPFQDQDLRAETSKTRGLKACVRCRMQKIRVRTMACLDNQY
jgi:hypothetical protein